MSWCHLADRVMGANVGGRPYADLDMDERRALRGLPLAGVAAAGVVIGHWFAYVLAIPQPHIRAEVLAGSGHGYWLLAVKTAVVLSTIAIATVALRHLRSLTGESRLGDEHFSRVALRLASVQIASFTAMEVAERAFTGASVAGMFQHHVFLLGLFVQLVVAAGGALFLLLVNRAASRLVLAHGSPGHRRTPAKISWFDRSTVYRRRLLVGATNPRSPPSL